MLQCQNQDALKSAFLGARNFSELGGVQNNHHARAANSTNPLRPPRLPRQNLHHGPWFRNDVRSSNEFPRTTRSWSAQPHETFRRKSISWVRNRARFSIVPRHLSRRGPSRITKSYQELENLTRDEAGASPDGGSNSCSSAAAMTGGRARSKKVNISRRRHKRNGAEAAPSAGGLASLECKVVRLSMYAFMTYCDRVRFPLRCAEEIDGAAAVLRDVRPRGSSNDDRRLDSGPSLCP